MKKINKNNGWFLILGMDIRDGEIRPNGIPIPSYVSDEWN